MSQAFSILDRLADSDDPRLVMTQELKALCNELELHGAYQILAWRREAERGGQIEIIITYESPS